MGGLAAPTAQTSYIRSQAYCAAGPAIYRGGAACGACFKVAFGGGGKVIQVVDQSTYEFECHPYIFERITGMTHGTATVTYKQVPCETDGCLIAAIPETTQLAYAKVVFNGLPYPVVAAQATIGARKFELQRVGIGAVFSFSHPALPGALGFSVTTQAKNSDDDDDDNAAMPQAIPACFDTAWPVTAGSSCKQCVDMSRTTSTTSATSTSTSSTSSSTSSTSSTATESTSLTSTATDTETSTATKGTTTGTTTTTAVTLASTTTTSTTEQPLLPVVPPGGTIAEAALPDPFYSVLLAEVAMQVNWSNAPLGAGKALTPVAAAALQARIVAGLGRLTGLPSPIILEASALRPGLGTLRLSLEFHVPNKRNASAIRSLLEDPVTLGNLSASLAQSSGGPAPQWARRLQVLPWQEHIFTQCQAHSLLCAERLIVLGIVQNAGVFLAYDWNFPIALLLVGATVVIRWHARRRFSSVRARGGVREAERGALVMPLMLSAFAFQAFLVTIKSLGKYYTLARDCFHAPPFSPQASKCPPTPRAMILEVVVFACTPVAVLGMFAVWWYGRWQADCELERGGLTPATASAAAMPLESVLRRSPLLSFEAVRATDKTSQLEHILVLVNNFLLSFSVVLVGFFALQRFEVPGRLAAWAPYKLVFELCTATLLKYLIRKAVLRQYLGIGTVPFVAVLIVLFAAVDVCMWVSIVRTCTSVGVEARHFGQVRQILDIAVGAGILNVMLSSVTTSMVLHMASVYLYEPLYRPGHVRVLCLVSAGDVERLAELVQAHEGGESESDEELERKRRQSHWALRGPPTLHGRPVRLAGLAAPDADDSGGGSAAASSSSPQEARSPMKRKLVEEVVPSEEGPVVVELKRRGEGKLAACLISLLDHALSVDKGLPLASACRELPGDADECSTASSEDTFGQSPRE